MPTFVALAEETGIPVGDLVHYALVRWDRVAGIVDWLAAGG